MLADGGSSQGSPTWLSVVVALPPVLSAIAAIWFPTIAGPRYRLCYGPLLTKQLEDGSWRMTIYLSSRGRRDITRDAFDDGKPLALHFGVPIRLTSVSSSRQDLRTVAHRAEGTRLLVGPGLIGRRQDLSFTAITKSEPVGVICQASLIDVRIRRQRRTPQQRASDLVELVIVVELLGWALVLFLLSLGGVSVNLWISFSVGLISVIAISGWISRPFWLRAPLRPRRER
jgi:hypothetical protein